MTRNIVLVLFAIFFAVGCFLAFVFGAHGHSWYDADCCSDQDCRPVADTDVLEVEGGWKYLPTGIIFNKKSKIRPSHDSRFHICTNAAGAPLCIYIVSGT